MDSVPESGAGFNVSAASFGRFGSGDDRESTIWLGWMSGLGGAT
jgi:hypothetical protein